MSTRSSSMIYESPDGGHTVYSRQPGSSQRTLCHQSPSKLKLIESLQHNKLWAAIHRASETDPVLKNMLEQIEIYHRLKNSP